MEMKLITLKLFLEELSIGFSIETLNDRKRIQKAVYLGQLSKFDLGYRFGWYLKGPYCPALAEDYYSLAEDIASADEEFKEYKIKPSLKERLAKVSSLFQMPHEIPLTQEDWLELVASYDYLRRVRKLSNEEADSILEEEKPRLAKYRDTAAESLKKVFPESYA